MKLNVRPLDEAWAKRCEELAEAAAKELRSLVLMISVQDSGKLGICTGGLDTPGEELDEMRKIMRDDPPHFFRMLAHLCEHRGAEELPPLSEQRPELQFMPGCFDGFEGTQQELQELMAELRTMFASGEIQRGARQLSPDEVIELMQEMGKRGTRQ